MLNKDAIVIAADSAVTTGRDPHPRYSKAANKIFDLSAHGNVALTIYASADIDRVPWELAVKLFRQSDAAVPQRPKLEDYRPALLGFLQGNNQIFPAAVRLDILKKRLFRAAVHVLNVVDGNFPVCQDTAATSADRQAAWAAGHEIYSSVLVREPVVGTLTPADVALVNESAIAIQVDLAAELASEPKYQCVDPVQLSLLAADALLKQPAEFLGSTGVVIAGYGLEEIFPSYVHLRLYGHIGDSLHWEKVNEYVITHDNDAWIEPFAQSSMIQRFTDGFDTTLERINSEASRNFVNSVLREIEASGVALNAVDCQAIVRKQHAEFITAFKKKNWEENFYPLRRVLNSLSVAEMGHLAESLLVLEALRERVTSPSESIGGPIDVAVITKGEGMIWLKRKHYFEPELNLRYLSRTGLA